MSRFDPEVESGRLTPISLVDRRNAIAVAGDHLARVVGRTIVDDNDLYVRMRLGQCTIDGEAQEAAVIMVVDDDTGEHSR